VGWGALFALVLVLSGPSNAIAQSQAKQDFCRGYADEAVASAARNESLACGYGGGRYTGDRAAHYGWCLVADEGQVREEAQIREKDLGECEQRALQFLGISATLRTRLYPTQEAEVKKLVFDNARTVSFSWDTLDESVDRVIWQVLSFPATEEDVTLRPPSLLGIGQSMARSGDSAKGRSGTFKLNAFQYFDYNGDFREGDVALLDFEKTLLVNPALLGALSQLEGDSSPAPAKENPADQALSVDVGALVRLNSRLNPPEPGGRQHVFVRVIPRHQDGSLGRASSPVRLVVPPKGADAFRPFRLVRRTLDPGTEADSKYSGCVRVLGHQPPPPGKEWRVPWALMAYPVPGTYCKDPHFPPQPPPSCDWFECVAEVIFEDIPGVVGSGLDIAKGLIDGAKDLATDIVSEYDPFCLQVGLISSDAADVCRDAVKTGSGIAIDAYLASNGIPPTIPSSDQLVSAAKGDLTEAAVALMEQVGVPCSSMTLSKEEAWIARTAAEEAGASVPMDTSEGVDVCRDVVSAAIDEVQEGLPVRASRLVAATAGLPYFPEVIAIPEPASRPSPVRVDLQFETTGVPIDPEYDCSATVRVSGKPIGTRASVSESLEPYHSKTISLPRPPRNSVLGIPKKIDVSVLLDQPVKHQFVATPSFLESRRAAGKFQPDGYSHILLEGNPLWARVESDCLGGVRPPHAITPVAANRMALKTRSSLLESSYTGPEWLPELRSRMCQGQEVEVPLQSFLEGLIGLEIRAVKEDTSGFCWQIEGYVATRRGY